MQYPVMGNTTGAIPSGTGITGETGPVIQLVPITSGRTLWLRHAWFFNILADEPRVILSDTVPLATGPTGVIAYNATDEIRYIIQCMSGATLGYNPVQVTFPPPGLKFTSYCSVSCDLTTCGVVCAGGAGYEE